MTMCRTNAPIITADIATMPANGFDSRRNDITPLLFRQRFRPAFS